MISHSSLEVLVICYLRFQTGSDFPYVWRVTSIFSPLPRLPKIVGSLGVVIPSSVTQRYPCGRFARFVGPFSSQTAGFWHGPSTHLFPQPSFDVVALDDVYGSRRWLATQLARFANFGFLFGVSLRRITAYHRPWSLLNSFCPLLSLLANWFAYTHVF